METAGTDVTLILTLRGLIDNAGLMALVVMVYSMLRRYRPRFASQPILLGLLFSLAGILTMIDPVHTSDGVQIDARNVVAALAAPFAGVPAAIIASASMSAVRFALGGTGAVAGVATILISAAVGWAFHRRWRGRDPSLRGLLALGMVSCSFLFGLLLLPAEVAWHTIRVAALPLALNTVVGVLVLGTFLVREQKLIAREHRFRREAMTDALTSLSNRRGFDRAARELAERPACGALGYSLLLIDVDHFKLVNDTYGHLAGDAVLAGIAGIVKQQTRGSDLVARFGGEEIAVLMPATSSRVAIRVAERIRDAIEATSFRLGTTEISVTVSVGAATASNASVTLPAVLRAADEALYEAKNGGRNRTELRDAA